MATETKCCINCGRDTKSKSGICGRCMGQGGRFGSAEQLGRRSRSSKTLGGTAIEDADDEGENKDYQGGSVRDDI